MIEILIPKTSNGVMLARIALAHLTEGMRLQQILAAGPVSDEVLDAETKALEEGNARLRTPIAT